MASLTYNTENKRIRTANSNSVAVIPSEDTENERIMISSDSVAPPENKLKFVNDGSGFLTIDGQPITEEYIDPNTLGLVVDSEGYIPVEV